MRKTPGNINLGHLGFTFFQGCTQLWEVPPGIFRIFYQKTAKFGFLSGHQIQVFQGFS